MTRRQNEGLGGEQVEGRRAVRELLVAGRRRVRTVWVAVQHDSDVLEEIVDLARQAGSPVRSVSREQLAELARTATPQGVVARADPVQLTDLHELLSDAHAFLVALDGVTDPQNLGAILRVAETAGATGVVLPRHRSARLSPAVAKAAAGALEYLRVAAVAGIPSALGDAARVGVWTIGLHPDGDASVFDLAVADRPLMLVLGAEGGGLSRLVSERCDVLAHIAMHGRLTSLNVAAAAAIACTEIARCRRPAHA